MQFTLSHAPDVINQHLDVTVVADSGQHLARVTTVLDSITLASDSLDPLSVQYEKSFAQVGQRIPGLSHVLSVTAQDDKGIVEVASKAWTDEN